jgi:hypothetical protein
MVAIPVFRHLILSCLFISLVIPVALGQGPYVRKGAIGVVESSGQASQENADGFPYVPIADWKGRKVVFLLQRFPDERYGCQGFQTESGDPVPPAKTCDGKLATVLDVIPPSTSPVYVGTRSPFPKVTLQLDDGTVYSASASGSDNSVTGIAFTDEIDSAREQFEGRALWASDYLLELRTFDPATQTEGRIAVYPYSEIQVQAIMIGWENERPVRFILRTADAREGFVDVSLSGSNSNREQSDAYRWDRFLLTSVPSSRIQWNRKVWDAIRDGETFIGMTEQQVLRSRGKPSDINQTIIPTGSREQWVYGSGSYLYFRNGVLEAIQD